MKIKILLLLLIAGPVVFSQPNEEQKIRSLLSNQTEAWNRGDIEAFMQPYWQSDSLMFIGKNGVVWGWENTLKNYKKGYPDTAAMGKLSFDIIKVIPLSKKYYSVVGKWMLKRTAGDLSGHYTLLLQKKGGIWVIVSDHSS